MRGLGIGRLKGGRSRVVGYVSTLRIWGVGSPIWDISTRKALWSLYSVLNVVVVAGSGWRASFGMRISHWSKGVLIGVTDNSLTNCRSSINRRVTMREHVNT